VSDLAYQPDHAVHPGEVLRELLASRGLTHSTFADRIGVDRAVLSHSIHGRRRVGVRLALRLEAALGAPSAAFWLNLQRDWDLHHARLAMVEELDVVRREMAGGR